MEASSATGLDFAKLGIIVFVAGIFFFFTIVGKWMTFTKVGKPMDRHYPTHNWLFYRDRGDGMGWVFSVTFRQLTSPSKPSCPCR